MQGKHWSACVFCVEYYAGEYMQLSVGHIGDDLIIESLYVE